MFLILLAMTLAPINSQEIHQVRSLNLNPGIYYKRIPDMHCIETDWKIIVFINIKSLRYNALHFTRTLQKLRDSCVHSQNYPGITRSLCRHQSRSLKIQTLNPGIVAIRYEAMSITGVTKNSFNTAGSTEVTFFAKPIKVQMITSILSVKVDGILEADFLSAEGTEISFHHNIVITASCFIMPFRPTNYDYREPKSSKLILRARKLPIALNLQNTTGYYHITRNQGLTKLTTNPTQIENVQTNLTTITIVLHIFITILFMLVIAYTFFAPYLVGLLPAIYFNGRCRFTVWVYPVTIERSCTFKILFFTPKLNFNFFYVNSSAA